MDDYSSLAALISSSILVVTSVAYFFGRLIPKIEKDERDKEAYIMDGFWFLLDYTFVPLVGIGIIELILQNRDTALISIILMLLLLTQVSCMSIVIKLMRNTNRVEVFCQSHIKAFYSYPVSLLTILSKLTNRSKKAVMRHIMIFFEIIFLYIFIKIYLTQHIYLFLWSSNIPQNYRMEIYIILSTMVTFMSLMVVRLFDAIEDLEAEKERLCLQNESNK